MTVTKTHRETVRIPLPGTDLGDQLRDKFLHDLQDILEDVRFMWVPKVNDTTISTDESLHGVTVTYDADITSRRSTLGSGVSVDFDGVDDEADTPDDDRLSFGDGAVDEAFSVIYLVKPDDHTGTQNIISKQNSSSVDEWRIFVNGSNGFTNFQLTDASSSASIDIRDNTDLAVDTWGLVIATYDGSRAFSGLNHYRNGIKATSRVNDSSGTYTALENTASLVRLGTKFTTNAEFFDGRMALVAVCAKEIVDFEAWAIKTLVNAFFDLSL